MFQNGKYKIMYSEKRIHPNTFVAKERSIWKAATPKRQRSNMQQIKPQLRMVVKASKYKFSKQNTVSFCQRLLRVVIAYSYLKHMDAGEKKCCFKLAKRWWGGMRRWNEAPSSRQLMEEDEMLSQQGGMLTLLLAVEILEEKFGHLVQVGRGNRGGGYRQVGVSVDVYTCTYTFTCACTYI